MNKFTISSPSFGYTQHREKLNFLGRTAKLPQKYMYNIVEQDVIHARHGRC